MTNSFDFPASSSSGAERRAETPDGDRFRRTATRADLLDAVMEQCPTIPRGEARAVFEMALEEIASALTAGDPVKLRSFGHFAVRAKRERMGRNPRTGDEVPITPRRVLTFKPSPVLLEAVNRGAGKTAARTKLGGAQTH